MTWNLSNLALVLGGLFCLPQIYALANPKGFADRARKFPRNVPLGCLLMAIGTLWFLYNLGQESISDFAKYKTLMLVGFGAVGLLTCLYVRDFLAVRGLAILLLMVAWFTLKTARGNYDTAWRLVLVLWAYLWVLAGMWLTISPWRLRDYIQWATATERRIRLGSALRLAFGLLVVILGLTALRA